MDFRNRSFETLTVSTRYGLVENVPKTTWKELAPYQHRITQAIFEVLIENCFQGGYVTSRNKDGFFAPPFYWKMHLLNKKKWPLAESLRFIHRLLKHESFLEAMGEFNHKAGVDWLSGPDLSKLGGFVYSVCFYLKSVLQDEKSNGGFCVKPKITKPGVS